MKSSLLTRSVSSEFSADLKHGDMKRTVRLILWWSHIESESHWDNYNGQERQEVHSTPELSHRSVSNSSTERMFWEKSRQRTNHHRDKTEENTTLMIGIGPATNTDLEAEMLGLYCTVLYCTILYCTLRARCWGCGAARGSSAS